jgi:hypothetical protein
VPEQGGAFRRERDACDPPVGGVGLARNETGVDECGEYSRRGRSLNPFDARQLAWREGAVALDRRKRRTL